MELGVRKRMLTVERRVAAPPESAWRVLTDLDAWPRWGPSVRRAELDGDGPLALGSRGKVWTPVGIALPFVVTEFEPGREWAWQVGGIPATRHSVLPDGAGCRVVFGVPIWAPAYLAVCAVALKRIDDLAVSAP